MEPIAIIGFSFKLPQGTTDESALWEMLESGRNVMTEWPDTRLTIDSLYDGGSRNQNTVGLYYLPSILLQYRLHEDSFMHVAGTS